MKIVHINTVPNGSTGTIMMNIHNELLKQGHESYAVWGRGRKAQNEHEIYTNDKLGVYLHVLYARLTGKVGFASKRATKKLLKKIDEIKPDIIHLHNIHGYYINIELMFDYIKKKNIKVVWTLHDCWAFTGHCTHFENAKCIQWKEKCLKCPQKNVYPKSFIDNSKWCYNKKKEIFCGANVTIVTPSKWLAELVKTSYLKNYDVEVINNGINTEIFKPTPSDFRKKYNLEDKILILGVANVWNEQKGLKDFIELSKILDDRYKIILIGLNKKQLKEIPRNILGLTRTNGQKELAQIYSSADIFFNPTYEDNYPTVNLESIACETPVITYNTGGSSEFIDKYKTGKVIQFKDYKKLLELVNYYFKEKISVSNEAQKSLSKEEMIKKYLELYKELGE